MNLATLDALHGKGLTKISSELSVPLSSLPVVTPSAILPCRLQNTNTFGISNNTKSIVY